MRAARLHAYGKPMVIEEVPTPTPGPGEVVIEVQGAGFCHSDLHLIDGEIQILPRLPITLGHENAGVVAARGAGVRSVRDGDPVLVFGGWGCGACPWCVSGDEQLCATPEWVGLSQHDGGYAEYLLVPHERWLVPLQKLAPREAAPLTDAALTPYRAIRKALPSLTPDVAVLVIGLGGLGQYGVKLLRLLCASPIVAVDVDPRKLALAGSYGASHLLDGRDADLRERVLALTGGLGVGAALDFVGSDPTLALAAAVTRPLGRVLQIGLAGGTARLKVLENTRFEVSFEATLWGNVKELREVVALAERGELALIEQEYAPLDAINDAYRRLKAGEVSGRLVITPGD
jgi:propanol-preferring alcohol dehydrogenase